MKEWYRNLIANPEEAVKCFMNDYTPYAPLLAKLSGLILDIGGGNGIVRHFLSDATQYIVIDPNLDWLGAKWANIAEHFPCLKTRPCFIRGIGEYLPFQAHSIDIALSFWSLNHTSQPEKVFCEIYQVLRPGGIFLLVLENMEPRWRDMLSPTFISKGLSYTKGILKKKLSCVLGDQEWPLQTDHIRIRESDILKWISGSFKISWRKWIGEYLTFELRKA
jgi:SAM-dependent methyltransferase